MRRVVWFSCGAASAVAAKLASEAYGDACAVVYCDTMATEMKKGPREAYQRPGDVHVFGYTYDEQDRAEQFEANNSALAVEWILIDQFVTKAECLRRLKAAGIALPAMYGLGFSHNNCLGCVKATSPGYWNRTRRLFPDVFARRAAQSRAIGARLTRIGEARLFLDELPEGTDGPDEAIECGPACQVPLFPLEAA